ncbi:MAG: tRNA pseudouridine(38,39,40) synthase TruA [Firmicutes bacterium ZCTH02-B6]|nr:MAG: tRNA pseudouridine(38,39,40) synthase TruA [Firmicutes bacterium ZCTH02-B6]
MRNIRCVVAYDGTEFLGFQRQAGGQTVQGVLEDAVASLTGEQVRVLGAGRTDAGVHAAGQVVAFRTASRIPVERWPYALNSRLPPSVVVTDAAEAPAQFHPRRDAVAKVYQYTIWNGRFPSPFWSRWALHVPTPLDVEAMAQAAAMLVGRHDFAAFRAAGSTPVKSTVRHLMNLAVERCPREPECVRIVARADGFLYHMVRNIAGTLLVVGQGRRPPGWVAEVLAGRRREAAGPTAPAHGLCLVRVEYG